MSQQIVPSMLLMHQPRGAVAFCVIQPSYASVNRLLRPLKFNSPEVNGIWLKADEMLEMRVREIVDRLE